MPTPTIFEGINPRGTQTFIPCKDISAFPRSEQEVLGAKNIMEFIAVNETINGVTQTVNDNKSVTINNTATGTCFFKVGRIKGKGSFILNGVTGGSNTTYGLTIRTADNQAPSFGAVDNYDGDTLFTIPDNYNDTLYINVRVPSGSSVNNVNIKTMLRLPTDPDPTYAPPTLTNKELTEKVGNNVYTGFAQGTTIQDMITTIINDYISNHNFVNGDTRTVACGITSVGYFVVNMTYTTNRVQGYVLNEANHLYIYHYNVNSQTLDIKEATLTAVS